MAIGQIPVKSRTGQAARDTGVERPGRAPIAMDREIPVDAHKAIVFPNRMRDERRAAGYAKLLRFASVLPDIPYIRLSKIERGEVVARPDELRRIAGALGIAPASLLIDIDAPDFDLKAWAQPFDDGQPIDHEEERFAILLGAALRVRRTSDPALSIAVIERDFGLPPVNLSRLENAAKPLARWNTAVRSALLRLFDVADEAALRARVIADHRAGALDTALSELANPASRQARTRARIAELKAALEGEAAIERPSPAAAAPSPAASTRALPVHGGAAGDGLIAFVAMGDSVDAPAGAGPDSFALRIGRPTLGGGLPGRSVVIADPAREPVPGGLAAVREGDAYRIVAVIIDRGGTTRGYSVNPDVEITLEGRAPGGVAAVIAALFP